MKQGVQISQHGNSAPEVRPIYQPLYNENGYVNTSDHSFQPQSNASWNYPNSYQSYPSAVTPRDITQAQYSHSGILVKPAPFYSHANQEQLQLPNYAEATAIPFATKS